MSFTAPFWLAAAAVIAAGVVVAHLMSITVPPRNVLPTARFIPEGSPLAVLRTRRVSDVALLLLRLLAVALFGLALAGAHVGRDGPPRVIVVDASRAVASIEEMRDSAAAPASSGSVIVAFDSVARPIARGDLSALMAPVGARGSMSAGIVAAHGALARVSRGRDSIELIIVSPVVREEVDSATARLLELWEGPVRFVRVAAAMSPPAANWEVRANGDDPVAAALSADPRAAASARGVRIVRTSPTIRDSLWARDSGGVLVVWPSAAEGILPRRAQPDSQGGFANSDAVVVGEFARLYRPGAGRVLVRWMDGEPAATEAALGRGCVRDVAIPVDAVGDVSLRASFREVARSMLAPCGGARDFSAVALSTLLPAEGASRGNAEPTASTGAPVPDSSLSIWLAAIALAALVAEQLLRARGRAVAAVS